MNACHYNNSTTKYIINYNKR